MSWAPEPGTVRTKAYPVIDSDPHAKRVCSYFRTSDYAAWAGMTAAFPLTLYAMERANPTGPYAQPLSVRALRPDFRIGILFGFTAGFLFAYQRSCRRFVGWSENRREYERDHRELSALAKEGKPLWGETSQPESTLRAAHYNSQWAFTKFHAVPWFNFVNHPWHGRHAEEYLQPCDFEKADADGSQ